MGTATRLECLGLRHRALGEIRNVNVRPFPGVPFTIPRYENIERSRHTGVEVGADLLLLADLSRRLGFTTGGDTLGWRTAYTWSRFVFVDDPVFNGNDLPGAPEHYIRSELRYDHPVGFWVGTRPGVGAHQLRRQQRKHRSYGSLRAVQSSPRVHVQTMEYQHIFRSPQPGR